MRKVFLDVGGFEGESSLAALDPLFGFDDVYCFEPVASCYEKIRLTITDKRFHPINAGLLDSTVTLPVHYAGSLGASVYDDAPRGGGLLDAVDCQFVRASEFFREQIESNDHVWMKLNCEGAEVAILNDLLDSGEAKKLHEVLVDFDAAKIPRMRSKVEKLDARLASAPFSFHYPPEVQFGMVTNFGESVIGCW